MIICDNIVFELQSVGGVSRHWSQTIARLDSARTDITFLEGVGAVGNRFRRELTLVNPLLIDRGPSAIRRFTKPRQRAEVFHSSYYRVSRGARANVVTIHDFMNEMFPSSFRDPILASLKRRACQSADAIATVSDRTRQDLLRHYPFVDPGRVHVIYNGVDGSYYPEVLDAPFAVGSRRLKPREFFLYVGTRGSCKNFPYVLEFVSQAYSQGLQLPLVVVGGGDLSPSEIRLGNSMGLPTDALVQLSGLHDAALRRLYSNCLALLIPSKYEGFGLPAAEAARCGALVLAARGSALDEIVGETEYAFSLDQEGEASRVLALGLDSARSETERVRVQERSGIFDWDVSAAKLMEIYDAIV